MHLRCGVNLYTLSFQLLFLLLLLLLNCFDDVPYVNVSSFCVLIVKRAQKSKFL